ncbi:MAG: protease inhibitor I42 family protein [Deltaproteobacteria bacterium]|nr:protease inhibitor I42 family protein [Deltaproteobacteria bacterium]
MRHLRVLIVSFAALAIGWACTRSPEGQAAPPTGEVAPALDLQKPGVHQSGPWEYRFIVVAPGSKSEGYRGELLYDGKPVPDGVVGDHYRTPWGVIQWVGDPATLWGEHGWMPRDPGVTGGRELSPSAAAAVRPIVMALVLGSGSDGVPVRVEPWVRAGMEALGAPSFHIEHPWLVLAADDHVIHDTKMYGTLALRIAQPREAETLSVMLDGSSPARVDLARVAGTTHVVRHVLDAGLEPLELFVALRVDEAGQGWPAPLAIGPADEGKTLSVRGVDDVVIALPGDRDSGLVWMITRLDGDALRHVGDAQFVPDLPPTHGRGGTFENVLTVVGAGTVEVGLELRRPWQEGAAPERTFRVTLKVEPRAR